MYTLPSVVLFCARHHAAKIGDTPTIISRAFRMVERNEKGMAFDACDISIVFTDANTAQRFTEEASSDREMLQIGLETLANNNFSFQIEIVLLALFGVQIPAEILQACQENRIENIGPIITKVLKARGVDWEEGWIRFEPYPPTHQPAMTN